MGKKNDKEKEKKRNKKEKKREKKREKKLENQLENQLENEQNGTKKKKKSEFEQVMTYIYLLLYIFLCIHFIIILAELLVAFIRNTRFRAMFGINPADKNMLYEITSGAIKTADNVSRHWRFKIYEYKFMASIILLMMIYGICVIIYVINKSIVYMVKGLRVVYNPFRKTFKKAGLGKLPKIPYNCVHIPKHIQYHYYMFLTSPKQCKFKSSDYTYSSTTKYSIFTSFGTMLGKLTKSISGMAPIIIWSFFAIVFICWVIFKMLERIYGVPNIQPISI